MQHVSQDFSSFIAGLLTCGFGFVVGFVVVLGGCQKKSGEPELVGHASPEEIFEKFRNAQEQKDWDTFCKCLTPDSLSLLCALLSLVCKEVLIAADDTENVMGLKGEDREKVEYSVNTCQAALETHKVDLKQLDNLFYDINNVEDEGMDDEFRDELTELGKSVADQPLFAATILNHLDGISEPTFDPPWKLDPRAKLGDVNLTGATADAKVMLDDEFVLGRVRLPGDSPKFPLFPPATFQRINGHWFIDFN